ncbi:unnamed protein product [Phaedon cochleariae]|uniref:Ig-like domain-containing protein n=1 Tax=Phaedon cochleariae TaxID=80249 RepID=A0A9P0GX85_PHACE|nr:unnamed protein product [Phaedon cochleariae]
MKVKIIVIQILILLILHITDALFGKSLKKLREKATGIYRKKNKGKPLNYLGYDQTEYPGTNPKKIQIHQQKWNDYYTCLKAQNESLGKYQAVTPEAILAFDGNNIKLACKICLSPEEISTIDSVTWEWAPVHGKHLELIEFTENIFESPEDKILHIYNLQIEHSGQYICRLGESLTAPYFLTVVDMNDTEIIEVHSPQAPLGPYPKDPEVIQSYNLILDTEWSDWSRCSTCDKIGKRHKLGYCSIYSKENKELSFNDMDNDTDTTTDEITNVDLELFSIFQFGIPCNSHILPAAIKELPQVKTRHNEIMIGYCKVNCPKNEIFEVKDKNGKVIEKANNTAGIYSLLQPLPPLEPPIERRTTYGVKGKTIVLTCPGNMNSDAPIQWQIGNKNLIPEIVSQESKGRIFISITDRIHIKNAKIADSNIYSCWQEKELAGTIRLIVEKKFEFNFNHHVMLLGIVVILAVFLHVFVKAFAGRKYAKT